MKKIKQAYYYLFYQLYRLWEDISYPKFWSEWKAGLSMDVLEIFLLLTFINYYTFITDIFIDFGNGKLLVMLVILFISIPNYFIFHHNDQWIKIINDFDQLSVQKSKKYSIIAWVVILLIIINLIFSFYCLDRQAKRNHTGPYSPEYIQSKNK